MTNPDSDLLTIERLGARADGIAPTPDGPLFVPYALPGERVRVERAGSRGRVTAVETPSPDRIEPFCPYFGRCGGCLTQHMAPPLYAAWKHETVSAALGRTGLDAVLAPLVDAHGEGRRRVTFHARRPGRETLVGFMAARSHDLVPVALCPVTETRLAGAAAAARAVAAEAGGSGKPLDVQATATEAGLDLDLRGHGPAAPALRQRLVAAATALDLARLSLHGDVIVERRPPRIAMGRASVVPPPGGFLQATAAGEAVLAGLVTAACGGARRVADLFAGVGPFALRLAEGAEVTAVDLEASTLAALDRAARAAPGLRRVTVEPRDLFRRPLLPPELDGFDAVVLDPPRAGADAQIRQVAASRVPLVVSVSCDAGTFARDAALLLAAGFTCEGVTPVDQFKHTPHIELVGIFRRPAPRARRR